MQRVPYTYNQAIAFCEGLQHLVGYAFDINNPSISKIECVAVSPFDQVNKNKFMIFYLLSGDAVKALNEEYRGLLFDIIVIAHTIDDENDLHQYNIDTWLIKNNLSLEDIATDQFNHKALNILNNHQ